ncbi:hypothetical protein B0H19DRAFT_1172284 [Mycena capillaripes]|nr:hypothetical protein B0H19DRAFT_1172284 [Mycena capillaripes]
MHCLFPLIRTIRCIILAAWADSANCKADIPKARRHRSRCPTSSLSSHVCPVRIEVCIGRGRGRSRLRSQDPKKTTAIAAVVIDERRRWIADSCAFCWRMAYIRRQGHRGSKGGTKGAS